MALCTLIWITATTGAFDQPNNASNAVLIEYCAVHRMLCELAGFKSNVDAIFMQSKRGPVSALEPHTSS